MASSVFLNPGNLSVGGNVTPTADNTYDLGSSSLQWRSGYFGTSVVTPQVTFTGGQVLNGATANVTELRNGTNDQQFNLYGSYTSATAHSKLYFRADDGDATAYVLTENGSVSGTALALRIGSIDDIQLEFAGNGGAVRWKMVNAAGAYSLMPQASNASDLGGASNLVRTGYFGTSVVSQGYNSGARSTASGLLSVTEAVTLSGATSVTANIIPAGAEVVGIATTTTTTITGASGYTVGDGSDADRYGSVTGTAVGTNTGSTAYTADPRWWTNAARAVTLTALTANFTGGVVQVTVFYRTATGA